MIRVAIVDDHTIVRAGLEQLLATTDDIRSVGTAANGDEALGLVARTHPDVALMDLSMPGVHGVEATRRIVAEHPDCAVLVLTSFGDRDHVVDALAAGARGYVLKHAEPDEIVAAIRALHGGGSPLDPSVARIVLDVGTLGPAPHELTARERDVLLGVRDGLANKQIARRLGITERTVKAHLTRAFQRLGVSDRTQAELWASRNLAG